MADGRYQEALTLLQDGLRQDGTVAAYEAFMSRLGEIISILRDPSGVAR